MIKDSKLLYQDLLKAERFFLIAGPCVIEDWDTIARLAETLKQLAQEHRIPFIFKASYLKANRTAGDSYRGPGLQEGLAILQKVQQQFELPVLTDVHETAEVKAAAEVCQILQIPAFLSRQTNLIQSAASSGRIINIKKGQFMAPEDMQAASEKVTSTGNPRVLLTERGTSFGYHNLVVDFRSFEVMHNLGFPVVYDVTHSLQQPSLGKTSGGTPDLVPMLAAAALATGRVSGLFIETHPHPETARSDAASMLALDMLPALLTRCLAIWQAIRD